jgi:hypothetical protein
MLYKGTVIGIGLIVITFGVQWLMERMAAYEALHRPKEVEGFWGPMEWVFSIMENLATISSLVTSSMGILTTLTIYAVVLASTQGIAIGMFQHFLCGGKWFGAGFVNGFQALWIMFVCMMDKTTSIMSGDCIRFYLVDIIYGLIYFIGNAVLSIIWGITGVDLHPVISIMWDVTVVPLDSMIFAITGKYITRWSDSTYTRCYHCSADFSPNGKNKTRYDNLTFYDWAGVLKCSIDEMSEGIYKMVTAVVPSRKWGAWAVGQHQDGGDDEPPFTF